MADQVLFHTSAVRVTAGDGVVRVQALANPVGLDRSGAEALGRALLAWATGSEA